MKLCFYRNIKSYFIALLLLSYSLIFCEQDQESHFNTHTVFHEDNEKTVTYEHCGSNDQGDYLFSATFEHTNCDTCQNVTCSDVSLNYQSDENVQTPEQETLNNSSSDWNDCHDQTSDADQFDFNEIFNKQNEYSASTDSQQNHDDHQYQNQRSFIYVWCKAIKEDCLGSSKKTLEARQNQLQKQKDQKKKETKQLQQQDVESELQQAYDEHQLSSQSSESEGFLQAVQKRNKPFDQSLKDPVHCTNQDFVLKNSTIGFMQAHNIDHHQFTQLHGLPIQHHVTQELITNLNLFVDIADKKFANQQLYSLIQSGILVTSMAQNHNQASQFCDAISSTNCSHGLVHYLQGMMVSGHNRCQKLLTSLTFFNGEIAKYTVAVVRGVSIGIVSSEIIDIVIAGLGKGASIIAPQLTSLIYSGATSIIVPIALTVGTLCAAGIIIEGSRLGYLYGTNQLDKVAIELDRIKSFAHQLYSFDQAPEKHVENIAMLSTTVVWPWQKQAIFEHLMGMQKVTCNLLIDAKNIVQHTKKVTQNQLHHALKYVKNSELQHFDILYKKIFNEHVFDFVPKNQPGLVPAGMHGFIDPADKAMLSHVMKTTGSTTRGHGTKFSADKIALTSDGTSRFLATDIGTKIFESITKDYERNIFNKAVKDYNKLLDNNTPQHIIDSFCKCHELSIVPKNINQDIEQLHTIFRDEYIGLEEFSSENVYLTMQMRHIFHPTLGVKLNKDFQSIREFYLNGFHHDEYSVLEKSGLFTYVDKIYGNAQFGAEECFKIKINFGNEIVSQKEKTFFPSSWSREKTVQVIFEAAQNRIEEIIINNPAQRKFECIGINNLIIEIMFNKQNVIISAYPSMKNF